MSFEQDLSRKLEARASAARVAPDLDDLGARIAAARRRRARRDRAALGAAVVVFVGALGGLVGTLVQRPQPSPRYDTSAGVMGPTGRQLGTDRDGGGPNRPSPHRHGTARPSGKNGIEPVQPTTVFSSNFAGGVSVAASLQAPAPPLAVTVAGGGEVGCAAVSVVTTAVERAGSVAVGIGVASRPALSSTGLEVLDSGLLRSGRGPHVWWLTAAVGRAVAQVAATGPGGGVVTVRPSEGIAVLAGLSTTSAPGPVPQLSAVSENAAGQSYSSLGVEIGSGPKAVGTSLAPSGVASAIRRPADSSCADLPVQPGAEGLAGGGTPASPEMAAAAVVAGLEEAYLPGGERTVVDPTGRAAFDAAPELEGPAPVRVAEVAFVSGSRAQVVYSVKGGLWQAGDSVLSGDRSWRVVGAADA